MNKIRMLIVMVATTTSLFITHCFAEGFRDKDYVSVEGGVFTYGDEVVDEVFGAHLVLFGSLNKVVNPNVAVLGKIEGIYGEGSSAGVDLTHDGLKGGLSLVYLVSPENDAASPYLLAGGLAIYNRVEGSANGDTADEDDSDVGFEVGGGIEFDLGPQSFADVGLVYQSVGDFDALTPNARLGFEFSEKTTGLLTAGYALDEEDYWVRLGLGVKL